MASSSGFLRRALSLLDVDVYFSGHTYQPPTFFVESIESNEVPSLQNLARIFIAEKNVTGIQKLPRALLDAVCQTKVEFLNSIDEAHDVEYTFPASCTSHAEFKRTCKICRLRKRLIQARKGYKSKPSVGFQAWVKSEIGVLKKFDGPYGIVADGAHWVKLFDPVENVLVLNPKRQDNFFAIEELSLCQGISPEGADDAEHCHVNDINLICWRQWHGDTSLSPSVSLDELQHPLPEFLDINKSKHSLKAITSRSICIQNVRGLHALNDLGKYPLLSGSIVRLGKVTIAKEEHENRSVLISNTMAARTQLVLNLPLVPVPWKFQIRCEGCRKSQPVPERMITRGIASCNDCRMRLMLAQIFFRYRWFPTAGYVWWKVTESDFPKYRRLYKAHMPSHQFEPNYNVQILDSKSIFRGPFYVLGEENGGVKLADLYVRSIPVFWIPYESLSLLTFDPDFFLPMAYTTDLLNDLPVLWWKKEIRIYRANIEQVSCAWDMEGLFLNAHERFFRDNSRYARAPCINTRSVYYSPV